MTHIWLTTVSQPPDNKDGPRRWDHDSRKTNQNLSLIFIYLDTRRMDLCIVTAKLRFWSFGPTEEACAVGENEANIQRGAEMRNGS